MAKVELIKLHPIEMCSIMCSCIAHCIGATYDNLEEIERTITEDEVCDCIELIRERMSR